jgi:hypothetical protein
MRRIEGNQSGVEQPTMGRAKTSARWKFGMPMAVPRAGFEPLWNSPETPQLLWASTGQNIEKGKIWIRSRLAQADLAETRSGFRPTNLPI